MRMLCYKCNHSWNYKGKNSEGKGYITCPGCYYKIRGDRALVKEPFKEKLLTNPPVREKLPTKLLSSKVKIPTTHTTPKLIPIKVFTNLADFNQEVREQEYKKGLLEIRGRGF